MKKSLGMFLLVLVGCHQEPEVSVRPGQLVGTWNSLSASASSTGKPFTRWTFDAEYVYTVDDTVKACQPVNSTYFFTYWLEGDILVMRYAGITNGLFPRPDSRRPIRSITATELVLDEPHQVLEKCP